MRCYYKGTFKDGNGKIVTSGTASVYLGGTTTAASIYTSLTGITAVNSVTSSSTDGTFEFYVDRFDYDSEQLFKIILSKSGFTSQTFDYVHIDSVVLTTYTISADKTVTTHLVIPKGVFYSVAAGKTLTLNGVVEAGPYQIFSGTGTATVGSATTLQHSSWWAAGGTNVLPIHVARHENGGLDEISVTGLSGLLADDQHVLDAEVLAVAAPLIHASRHQDTGADEINLDGLIGSPYLKSPWVDIRALGAKIDGSTDDTAAIESAWSYGNKVLIPEGTSIITSIDNIPSNGEIFGMGKGVSILKLKGGVDAGTKMLKNTDRVSGNSRIKIHDLTLDGNRAQNGAIASLTGIDFFTCTYCDIQRLRITGFTQHGIDMTTSNSYNVIAFNEIDDYGLGAIGFAIVVLQGCHSNKIIGNNCTSTLANLGICIDDRSGELENIASTFNIVSGNFCTGMKQGITIAGSHKNTVQGNTMTAITEVGILVCDSETTGSQENSIVGNIISVTGATADGIEITGELNGFIGNIIHDPRYGIHQKAGLFSSENNIIIGNQIYSASSTALYIEGGGIPTMYGNRFTTCTGEPVVITPASYTDGDLTPSVLSLDFIYIANTVARTITDFDDAFEGQVITCQFADSNTTVNRDHCWLAGGINFTGTAGDTLTLKYYGGSWYEVCRSVNA